jgi:uncharacterized membrane protein YbhN (UPF0104 family)
MKELVRWWRSPLLRYGLTICLLGLIFWKVVNPTQLWSTVQRLSVAHLLLAMALTVPFLLLKALRWHLLLRSGRCRATFTESFVSLIGGMGIALLTPARLGEVTRAAYLSEPRKVRVGALVMVDKIYDVIILSLLSVAGAMVLVSPIFALALAGVGGTGVYLALRPRDLRTLYKRVGARLPFYAKVDRVLAGFAEFRGTVGLQCLLYTLAAFIIVLLQYLIILNAWNKGSLQIVVYCFPMVVLTNAVPLTVAGLGTREGAAILLLKHYHVAASIASTSAFLMSFMNTVLPGLIGAVITPFFRRRPGLRSEQRSMELPAIHSGTSR